jgi:phosphoribosyl 1,2-cyclic phosphodiesterase
VSPWPAETGSSVSPAHRHGNGLKWIGIAPGTADFLEKPGASHHFGLLLKSRTRRSNFRAAFIEEPRTGAIRFPEAEPKGTRLVPDNNPEPPAAGNGEGISLRFWGVRGSVPTPGPSTVRYGGNTLCVELRCGPHLLILDAGSGVREFGKKLAASGVPVDADILLSHTHLDHIIGLPFFAPMFDPKARIRFWAGHLTAPDGIAQALLRAWRAPLMPDMDAAFRASLTFRDFSPGDALILHPGLRVTTLLLNHPGNAVGYRIEWQGSSVCYVTDTEHPKQRLDRNLAGFAAGTDILIYDANFTDDEYQSRIGWGHSTWQVSADLADAAKVGKLVLFHHDPNHDDATMDTIAGQIAARRPGSVVAMEGMRLQPDSRG